MCNLSEVWIAAYDYAHDDAGRPMCSFARERIVKNGMGVKFKYFVHEGFDLSSRPFVAQYARTWGVTHRRTASDLAKDKGRNLNLFAANQDKLDSRMRYYYGKELFENNKPMEAYHELVKAAAEPGLQQFDRILALQYACSSAMVCNQFDNAIQLAHQGLQLTPRRAEFLIILGDCYLKKNLLLDAIPFFEAAKACKPVKESALPGPIFEYKDAYGTYPLKQLSRIWMHAGDSAKALSLAMEAQIMGGDNETGQLISEIQRVQDEIKPKNLKKVKEFVITAAPGACFYDWDEEIEKETGVGGSEIAAIRMARYLHELTGYKVRVFNKKEGHEKDFGGVTYEVIQSASKYFSQNEPLAHISWRHTIPLTSAPQYVWCHDLLAEGMEDTSRYHKVLALSEFHKRFMKNLGGVPDEKIIVTRNGIDAHRFMGKSVNKQVGKIVWPSSADRGLERAVKILDMVCKDFPHMKFHVFYGFDNMRKRGMLEEVRKYENLAEGRPWLKFRGNLPQTKLHDELRSSHVWLYPTNFLETFCITALETQSCGVYGLVRGIGALPNTLSPFDVSRATVLHNDCETESDLAVWAQTLCNVLGQTPPEPIDPTPYDWKNVAKEWLEFLPQ